MHEFIKVFYLASGHSKIVVNKIADELRQGGSHQGLWDCQTPNNLSCQLLQNEEADKDATIYLRSSCRPIYYNIR